MNPFYTVVIPTCHRNDLLARCLDRLQPGAQRLGADRYEVIVSDDGRACTAEALVHGTYPWARWVDGPKRGPAANRNSGARHASGQWLVFLDDDCLPDRKWLAALDDLIPGSSLGAVEGKTVTPDREDNPFIENIENLRGTLFYSCNLAVRRDVFFDTGGFDEDFLEATMEDLEFASRLQVRGIRTAFCEEAVVIHPKRKISFSQLVRRTKMLRWRLLLEHKTGTAVPLSEPLPSALCQVGARAFVNQLRASWHVFKYWDPSLIKSRAFYFLWNWITFPLMVPYLLFWEIRFREMLKLRARESANG